MFGNANGWSSIQYYQTIRIVACSDVLVSCGRNSQGYLAGRLDTPTSIYQTLASRLRFTDAEHWDSIYRYKGLLPICVGNFVYVVGSNLDNLEMEWYSLTSNTWNSAETITSLTCTSLCQVCATTHCTYCSLSAYTSSSICLPCAASCLHCTSSAPTDCVACQAPSYLPSLPVSACVCQGSFHPDAVQGCIACKVMCFTCNSFHCLTCRDFATLGEICVCMQGYLMDIESGNCYKCPRGIYLDTSTCSNCEETCETCTQASSCSQCYNGAVLSPNGTCNCVLSYFPDPSAKSCALCSSQCLGCISPLICTSCRPNAEIQGNACICSQWYSTQKRAASLALLVVLSATKRVAKIAFLDILSGKSMHEQMSAEVQGRYSEVVVLAPSQLLSRCQCNSGS